MKEFLLVLFYQAIVAVNTAVILSGIIWLAKRKEKKDGRKPNPDFTPPPEKKPEVELRSALIKTVNGEKIAQRWYSPDEQIPQYAILQAEPYKFFAEMDKDGGKFVEFARIKPPTTVQWGGYQPKPCEMPKPPTTGSAAVKPKCGISADEAAKLFSKLAEASACLGGNSELDELRERVKDLAYRLDRAEKKPVTQERLKEAGLEVEYLNAKCGECKNWKRDNQIFGHCALRRCPVKEYERRQCQFFEKWEPPAKTTHICRNCKHFLTTDEEYLTGTCGLNEEITFANSTKACFESKPSTSIVRPKPLGTITTH